MYEHEYASGETLTFAFAIKRDEIHSPLHWGHRLRLSHRLPGNCLFRLRACWFAWLVVCLLVCLFVCLFEYNISYRTSMCLIFWFWLF